jgi:glycosyltransferase involved in cell wall biosynthesis
MSEWLTGRVRPVTSTRFIADELEAYCPLRTYTPEVVYLSTFATTSPGGVRVAAAMERFGLPEGYILCPTHVGPHKNVGTLLRALGRAKRCGLEAGLVLTGSGTDCLGADPSGMPAYDTVLKQSIDDLNTAIEEEGLVTGRDIWPLGYVSDADMDALVRGASLVVAPSIYEAGSGPALDAWWLGTPVACSALPPVVEQMAFLGTDAVLFDPVDVEDMARALITGLTERERMKAAAVRSREAMTRYSWDDVARGYVGVFRRALEEG